MRKMLRITLAKLLQPKAKFKSLVPRKKCLGQSRVKARWQGTKGPLLMLELDLQLGTAEVLS